MRGNPQHPDKHLFLSNRDRKWKEADCERFRHALKEYGKDFKMIAKEIKTKKQKDCRAYYNSLCRAVVADPSHPDADFITKTMPA